MATYFFMQVDNDSPSLSRMKTVAVELTEGLNGALPSRWRLISWKVSVISGISSSYSNIANSSQFWSNLNSIFWVGIPPVV